MLPRIKQTPKKVTIRKKEQSNVSSKEPSKDEQPRAMCRVCKEWMESRYLYLIHSKKMIPKEYDIKIRTFFEIDLTWDVDKDSKICHKCSNQILTFWDFR